MQKAVRDAIPMVMAEFASQPCDVRSPGFPTDAFYLVPANGGHVFQTQNDYNDRIRTKLFFPMDQSQPFPQGLSKADKRALMVLAAL